MLSNTFYPPFCVIFSFFQCCTCHRRRISILNYTSGQQQINIPGRLHIDLLWYTSRSSHHFWLFHKSYEFRISDCAWTTVTKRLNMQILTLKIFMWSCNRLHIYTVQYLNISKLCCTILFLKMCSKTVIINKLKKNSLLLLL